MSASNRKLAAIVFTDIVGFTRLSADNQSKSSALIKKQRETFQPIVQNFKGTWVKEMGDGLLLTFDTITDAVKSSIEMQKV
ncbi:MAG: adenylate/guanylate cyclase domain-containing protein, partial [Candidatus Neomarinimicrobiota bacterium]